MNKIERQKLIDIVLSYPKLQERVKDREQEKQKVIKNIDEIRADYSPAIVKFFAKALDFFIHKLYNDINFSLDKGVDFVQLLKDNNVIFVPNHQSHADYVALNYIIYKKYKLIIYGAGGINLNIFGLGKLFRKSGCFFIRRTFTNDPLYKTTLEAYLYYLLLEGKPIEFFFEGGRSRTGKLLPPRYGLFQMLLEAHKAIPEDKRKKLLFMPVSIQHEYVPEHRSLARELDGGKKRKESFGQLFKLFKLFSYQLGSVHIGLGETIQAANEGELKRRTQDLAFDCFRAVGRNMLITPSSLLALILLDEPSGALRWEDIFSKAERIVAFCKKFSIPYVDGLKKNKLEQSLESAIDLFIANRKINVIGQSKLGHVFYSIKTDARKEMLYFKNTILHHFLVPWTINLAWINVFSGDIDDFKKLTKMFLIQRSQLTHEFYLPTVEGFVNKALNIISYSLGREISKADECMDLNFKDFYSVACSIGVFSRSCSYIQEGYYVAARTLKFMNNQMQEFKFDDYIKNAKEIFEIEVNIGRIIKYRESFSLPLMKSSLDFFTHQELIVKRDEFYSVSDDKLLDTFIKKYERDLTAQLTFNMRV